MLIDSSSSICYRVPLDFQTDFQATVNTKYISLGMLRDTENTENTTKINMKCWAHINDS